MHVEKKCIPRDFADRMLEAIIAVPLPIVDPDNLQTHRNRLKILRARALVHILHAAPFRMKEVQQLTISVIDHARTNGGYITLERWTSGPTRHAYFGEDVFRAIEDYLRERGDKSPWLLIQHGRSGVPRVDRRSFYLHAKHGYGARLSKQSSYRIIRDVAILAGYDPDDERTMVSPRAFFIWHHEADVELLKPHIEGRKG